MRTRWPLMVLLFVIPGAALTYWSPEMISSAAPSADEPAAVQLVAPAAAAAPPDGWQTLPPRYDAKKVATVSLQAPAPIVVDEPATDTQASAPAPSAAASECRKYLRPVHLPKAAPKAKAVGLLDPANDKAAKSVDPSKAVAILNQRILKADDCLKRAGPGS